MFNLNKTFQNLNTIRNENSNVQLNKDLSLYLQKELNSLNINKLEDKVVSIYLKIQAETYKFIKKHNPRIEIINRIRERNKRIFKVLGIVNKELKL